MADQILQTSPLYPTDPQSDLKALKALWARIFDGAVPDDHQFAIWLEIRPFDVCRWALMKTAARDRQYPGEAMSFDHRVRYVSSVLRRYDGRPVGGRS